jgi:Uma2 family endonuclease
MAIARPPQRVRLLTYEAYIAEGEVLARYDIIDGERLFMTNPTRWHQDVQSNLADILKAYGRRTGRGRMYLAPCDILISRQPLRTRQPDVLFISNEQLALNGSKYEAAPLTAAPELVVEIVSPSNSPRNLEAAIADYRSVGVKECWLVDLVERTVEVLQLSENSAESAGTFAVGDEFTSVAFTNLSVCVAEIFAE